MTWTQSQYTHVEQQQNRAPAATSEELKAMDPLDIDEIKALASKMNIPLEIRDKNGKVIFHNKNCGTKEMSHQYLLYKTGENGVGHMVVIDNGKEVSVNSSPKDNRCVIDCLAHVTKQSPEQVYGELLDLHNKCKIWWNSEYSTKIASLINAATQGKISPEQFKQEFSTTGDECFVSGMAKLASDGTYRTRLAERERIHRETGIEITRDTHESEHIIGFNPLTSSAEAELDVNRASFVGKQMEGFAPAYYEEKANHRAHIGTGNRIEPDGSGLNAQQYREIQNAALVQGSVVDAMVLNQLCYTFVDNFSQGNPDDNKASDNSFNHMLSNTNNVTFIIGDGHTIDSPLQEEDKTRVQEARNIARNGDKPTALKHINETKKKYNVTTASSPNENQHNINEINSNTEVVQETHQNQFLLSYSNSKEKEVARNKRRQSGEIEESDKTELDTKNLSSTKKLNQY